MKLVCSKETIATNVKDLAKQVSTWAEYYNGLWDGVVFMCLSEDGVFFFSDLVRNLTIENNIEMQYLFKPEELKATIDPKSYQHKVVFMIDLIYNHQRAESIKNSLISHGALGVYTISFFNLAKVNNPEPLPDWCSFRSFAFNGELVGYGKSYLKKHKHLSEIYFITSE